MERLVLFAKAPRLHEVKTRLAPRLTPSQALELHEAMLADQIAFVDGLAGPDRSAELCLDRDLDSNSPRYLGAGALTRTLQGEGDLGARMHRAILRALSGGAARVAIIGADAPTLPGLLVEEAFGRLARGADAVVVPAEDGGYVLVGASRPVPALFAAILWGTPSVLADSRRRALEAGLALEETERWHDVDVAADLSRLSAELGRHPSRAPATAAFLAGLGLYGTRDTMV